MDDGVKISISNIWTNVQEIADLHNKTAYIKSSSGSEWGRAPFLDEKFADSVLPVGSVEK